MQSMLGTGNVLPSSVMLHQHIFSVITLKGRYYAPFLTRCKISGVSNMCLWSFISNYPTYHLLYNFENAYFKWNQKLAVFVHVSLNANELLLPALFFQNRAVPLQLIPQILCQKNTCLVLIIMYIALKSCVFNHISLNFWYTVRFSERTHPKHAHRKRLHTVCEN